MCKPNVESSGRASQFGCDVCQSGTFNLVESNPDGCTKCFCFGKASSCKSHESLKRTQVRGGVWGG